jgi:hypothetical protein
MKWTAGLEVPAGFFQWNTGVDNINNISLAE